MLQKLWLIIQWFKLFDAAENLNIFSNNDDCVVEQKSKRINKQKKE